MVPAWVAPFVRSPPSSPAEVTRSEERRVGEGSRPPGSSLRAKQSLVPTITVYVPVVGAVVATCTAEAPAELVASSTPVGDSRRIRDVTGAETGALSLMLSAM